MSTINSNSISLLANKNASLRLGTFHYTDENAVDALNSTNRTFSMTRMNNNYKYLSVADESDDKNKAINNMGRCSLAESRSNNYDYVMSSGRNSFLTGSSSFSKNANLKRSQTLLNSSIASSSTASPQSKFNTLSNRINARLNINNRASLAQNMTINSNNTQEDDNESEFDEEEEDIDLNLNLDNTTSPSTSSKESSASSTSPTSSTSSSCAIYTNSNVNNKTINSDININPQHQQSNQQHQSKQNEKVISQLFRDNNSFMNKPTPPSRSSSLQYRTNPSLNLNKMKSKFYKLNPNEDLIYNNFNTESTSSNYDRGSIYSSFSLRTSNLSRLSSFNLTTNDNLQQSETAVLLNKIETFKIESCYKSMCSTVYAARCMSEFHTTNLDNLVRLLDWKYQLNGIPVWVFNTGLNPKREKSLSLVLADKKTGFAIWRLNNLSYLNDLKWTKPGHLTFKIFSHNLTNPEDFGLGKDVNQQNSSSSSLSSSSSSASSKLKRKFSLKRSKPTIPEKANQEINCIYGYDPASIGKAKDRFIFGAIKFESEFECSKFYDHYRNLFVDSRNDDLFSPTGVNIDKFGKLNNTSKYSVHQDKTSSSSTNFAKILYKKITKNSISSPCAFHHINGLSVLNDDNSPLSRIFSPIATPISTPTSAKSNYNNMMDNQSIVSNITLRSSSYLSRNQHNDSASIVTVNDSIINKIIS